MADTSDVQQAIALLAADLLYPAGSSGISGYSSARAGGYGQHFAYGSLTALQMSAAGVPVRIYRGWPVAQQLDPDLATGICHMTVVEERGGGRLAPGRLRKKTFYTPGTTTLAVMVSGNTVAITGQPVAGVLVGILIEGVSTVYLTQQADTLLTIANALASQFTGPTATVGGSNMAASLTFATTLPVTARIGALGQILRYIRRQTQIYRLSCWAHNPAARDAICSYLDARLSDTNWLQLPDQRAWMIWSGTRTDDVTSKAALWRRDLMFTVTWWTSIGQVAAPLLFPNMNLTGGNGTEITITS